MPFDEMPTKELSHSECEAFGAPGICSPGVISHFAHFFLLSCPYLDKLGILILNEMPDQTALVHQQ